MKAEELQVGDWVKATYEVLEDKNVGRINTILRGMAEIQISEDTICATFLHIEPIPLTKEILESNGFYFGYTSNEEDLAHNTIAILSEEDKGWVWDEGEGEIKVIFPNESDGGMINIDDQSFNRHLTFVFTDTIYVHELQHALRMACIDKEVIIE